MERRAGSLGLIFLSVAHIDAVRAWDLTRGERSVVVSVADDSCDLRHTDFQGPGKVVAPRDFAGQDFEPLPELEDDNHGTACCGVAVAEETGSGVVGMAAGCALMPIRTSGFIDVASTEDLCEWVIDQGASVLSCSWSAAARYFGLSLRMRNALHRAATLGRGGRGCVLVFAAGNENRPVNGTVNETGWPNNQPSGPTPWLNGFAAHEDVVAVAASSSTAAKSAYSNWGREISVCAPSNNVRPRTYPLLTVPVTGRGIVTTDSVGPSGYSSTDYRRDFGGTSSACPTVAGVAALVLSANPELTAKDVRDILKSTADKIVDENPDPQLGTHFGSYDARSGRSTRRSAASTKTPWISKSNILIDLCTSSHRSKKSAVKSTRRTDKLSCLVRDSRPSNRVILFWGRRMVAARRCFHRKIALEPSSRAPIKCGATSVAAQTPGERSVNPPRCIVFSDHGEGELARNACACLAPVRELELLSERLPQSGETIPFADVLVVPVEAATMQCALDFLTRVRLEAPSTSVLVVGAQLTQEHIFHVLTAGAYDFVSAPYSGAELVARTLRGVGLLESKSPQNIRSLLSPRASGLIGNSPAFVKQMARLPLLAGCDAGVLILGETGTGKELFAQAVHYLSARVSRPWVPVNCSAVPVELIEAELFGHTKGAYTTAHSAREGLIAAAEGGTLLLDEIGSLPPYAQGKLLRFLQEREYRPVGSNALRRANVRVIAASNQDLAVLVAKDRFRQDLYFRLNVLTLILPPLRERREDIPTLALHFIKRFATEFGRPVQGLTPMAMKRLLAYPWPGNVRELSHAIERAVLLGHGLYITPTEIEIGVEDQAPADESFQAAKARVVEQFERSYIEQILIACDGNITHAAKAANKNRRALWELIRKHRIEPKRFRSSSETGGAKSTVSP